MWLGRGRRDALTVKDRLLLVAFELYERSVCGRCGYSSYLTTHGDYAGHFHVVDDGPEDLACASLDRWQERTKDAKHPAGQRVYVDFDFDPKGR